MTLEVNEAMLEMHFHYAIRHMISKRTNQHCLEWLKPTQQMETWVGFDQGWIKTRTTDTNEIYQEITDSIKSGHKSKNIYFGFFLQFKIVSRVAANRTKGLIPYKGPYYRSKIDCKKNASGSFQHQTLIDLDSLLNMNAAYACPMIFSRKEVYGAADLGKLICVSVSTSPTNWLADENHYIAFKDNKGASPKWCSEPVDAESMQFADWFDIESVVKDMYESKNIVHGNELADDILAIQNIALEEKENTDLLNGLNIVVLTPEV